jgi:hypothetical protein
MTTVLMMFILPLGIVFYLFDKKTRRQNTLIFESYVEKIIASDISQKEKIEKIDEMYYENGYTRVSKIDNILVVQKKHFNLGVLFIMFGAFSYFGIVFFFIYYRFILKPDKIKVSVD